MRLYITGGGTGGHVTPGLAIARYFEKRQPETVIRFAGSARGIENKLVPREGYPLDAIEINGAWRGLWLTISRLARCGPGGEPADAGSIRHRASQPPTMVPRGPKTARVSGTITMIVMGGVNRPRKVSGMIL